MLEKAHNFCKQAMTSKKPCDFMNIGYKELIPETKSLKSIRKTFDYHPEDTVSSNLTQKLTIGTAVYKRSLNYVFLDLFSDQYQQANLSQIDRYTAGLFIYEIIITTKFNITIIGEKLIKYSFKTSDRTKNFIIAELIVTEVIKTFQTNGILVFLVSLSAYLIEHRMEGADEFKNKLQAALEKIAIHVNDLSLAGLESLASWFAHLKVNTTITMAWLKDLKTSDKGKFLISRILRNLMQLSSYSSLNEGSGVAEFIDFFPQEPKPHTPLQDPSHSRNSDYRLLVENFGQEVSGEDMTKFLNSNELSCFGSELQDVFHPDTS